jgi:Zn-dependent peptidase ImmA (M78 family)
MISTTFPDYRKARSYALNVLSENRVKEPPVFAVDLAKKYGLSVICAEFDGEDADCVAGFLDSGRNRIVVNDIDSPSQQNFTVAHELGHYLLRHHEAENYKDEYSVLLRDTCSMEQTWLEREANCFAENLLVPVAFLREYVAQYPRLTNLQLANIFGVPESIIAGRRIHI